jgi:predicted DNA-binding transcriptional regulator AlpA
MLLTSYMPSPAGSGHFEGASVALDVAAAPAREFAEFSERDLALVRCLIDQLSATAIGSTPRAIRRRRVLELTGFGNSHLYNLSDPKSASFDPTWPRSFRLGNSSNSPVVWWEHAVVAWVKSKAAAAEAMRDAGGKRPVRRTGVTRKGGEQ